MRIFNACKKLFFFLFLLFVINSFISFVWLPADSSTEFTVQEYQKCSDLDTIFFGSSLCSRSFIPTRIDEIANTNSFNLGTPAQALNQTFVALQAAKQDHPLKTAIIAMNYSNLKQTKNPHADVSFLHAFCKDRPVLQRAKFISDFVFSSQQFASDISINFFFPWVYNNAGFHSKDIINNVLAKLNRDELTMDNYIGRGFRYTNPHLTLTLDYSSSPDSSSDIYPGSYNPAAFDTLEKICDFCLSEEIDLVFINTPCPDFDILIDPEEYFSTYTHLCEFFSSHSADYYDFNLAKPLLFQNADHYYSDFEHLNKAGCEAFSDAFGHFLQFRNSGTDISSLFYSPQEYLSSIDQIALVDFVVDKTKQEYVIRANALIGISADIEYEFSLINPETDQQFVFQPYSQTSSASISSLSEGDYSVRVNARQAGSQQEYERYCIQPIQIP